MTENMQNMISLLIRQNDICMYLNPFPPCCIFGQHIPCSLLVPFDIPILYIKSPSFLQSVSFYGISIYSSVSRIDPFFCPTQSISLV